MGKVIKPEYGKTQWERQPFRDRILRLINQGIYFRHIPDQAPFTNKRPTAQSFAWPSIDTERLRADQAPTCFVWFTEEVVRRNVDAVLPTAEEIEEMFLKSIIDRGLDALELLELRLQVYQSLKWFATTNIEGEWLQPSEYIFVWEKDGRSVIGPPTGFGGKRAQSHQETMKYLQEIAASAKRRHERD